MKIAKRILFFVLLGLSLLGIPVFIYGIINTGVSLKYETQNPTDCISTITGQDLCLTIHILKGLIIVCVLIIVLLIVFRKRFLESKPKR